MRIAPNETHTSSHRADSSQNFPVANATPIYVTHSTSELTSFEAGLHLDHHPSSFSPSVQDSFREERIPEYQEESEGLGRGENSPHSFEASSSFREGHICGVSKVVFEISVGLIILYIPYFLSQRERKFT